MEASTKYFEVKPEGKDLLDTLRKSLIERANGM